MEAQGRYQREGPWADEIPDVLDPERRGRPTWLLSAYTSPTWAVRDTGVKRNLRIKFDPKLPNDMRLSSFPHLQGSIMRVVFGVRTGPLATISSGSVQVTIAQNLLLLARWMIGNEMTRFSELVLSDVTEYSELAVFGSIQISNAEVILRQFLQTLSEKLDLRPDEPKQTRAARVEKLIPEVIGGHPRQLLRERLMISAGLEGLGSSGKNSLLSLMLDEFENTCGLYQSLASRRRMQESTLADQLDQEKMTDIALRRLLLPFQYLYRHRGFLEDSLTFDPFPVEDPRITSRRLARGVGRTRTVPVKQAVTLIERSIRWVVNYAPTLLKIKKMIDAHGDRNVIVEKGWIVKLFQSVDWPVGPDSPFPLKVGTRARDSEMMTSEVVSAPYARDFVTLPLAQRYLVTACATVIAAFSARRAAEIIGLRAGCIERDDAGNPWLRVFIHKSLDQEETIIPVPEIVCLAVGVLEEVSQRARSRTKTAFLFQYDLPGLNTCIGMSADQKPNFPIAKALREYGYFINVPPLPDGTKWLFLPHQFRRFFAILYMWIYELGDWAALSYFLRHFDPEKTRRYGLDDELGHVLAMANREHTATILAHAALGKVRLGGMEGERLTRIAGQLYNALTKQVQVVTEEKLIQRISRCVEASDLELRALPWGFCGAPRGKSSAGFACSNRGETRPDYAGATVSTCNLCAFGIKSNFALPYLRNSRDIHKKIQESPQAPAIMKRASESLLRQLQGYLTFAEGTGVP
jgi:hypothetical protein